MLTINVSEFYGFNSEDEMIINRLEHWAKTSGERPALYYGEEGKTYSYRELNELANSFANSLITMGIEKGDRISLFLKNPKMTIIAMLGIYKAGAVFCPINFNYKSRLLSYQIVDTNPKILVTESKFISLINDIAADIKEMPVILYEPEPADHDYEEAHLQAELIDKFPVKMFKDCLNANRNNPNIPLYFYDIANIIYTSGTTGPAKGVVQSYRWIHGYSYISRAFCNQDDVIYNDLPLYHVGGAFSLVARAIFVGCKVALWDKFSPSNFWSRIEESGATNATLLDVMIPWLMKADPSENDRHNTLKKVHMQPLPKYHHEVAKRFGFDFVTSGFGQTESGSGFHSLIVEAAENEGTPQELYKGYSYKEMLAIAEKLNVPIIDGKQDLQKGFMGLPTPHLEVAILDENDQECDVGEIGQIGFRSKFPHTFLYEYYNKDKATVEAFRNLWFHTGDTAYQGTDGFYYFVDRMNNVIRSRGENISSYQVEDLINQNEFVHMCAAFPIDASEGDEDDIVVYIVLKEENAIDKQQLEDWIKETMPRFMWPKYVRFIAELPQTPTNKVKKYELKEQILREINK